MAWSDAARAAALEMRRRKSVGGTVAHRKYIAAAHRALRAAIKMSVSTGGLRSDKLHDARWRVYNSRQAAGLSPYPKIASRIALARFTRLGFA